MAEGGWRRKEEKAKIENAEHLRDSAEPEGTQAARVAVRETAEGSHKVAR